MRDVRKLLLVLSLLPLSLIVKADNGRDGKDGKSEPVLNGYVSDATTKKPVQGVTISIKSPKLQVGKEFVTDASGNFKIPELPSGEVTIVLEKKGYKTCRREGVVLKEGITIRLNFDMSMEEDIDENDVFHPLLRMMNGL
jgi:hypothetical protein